MSLGTILLVILVIVLLGGFSGFGGGPSTGRAIMAAAGSASDSLSCWSWFCSAGFELPRLCARLKLLLHGYPRSLRVSNSIQISIADKRRFVTVKRAATSVNPNPHEILLSVFLADARLSVDSETFARAFGLPTSAGSIPSRATEFTMMIRLTSAGLFEVLPVLCGCRGWPLLIVT